jgi:hypothetical protein
MKHLLLTLMLAFVPMSLMAQETTPAPFSETATVYDDATQEIVELDEFAKAMLAIVKDGKGMGKGALAIALLNLLIMALKTKLASEFFKKRHPGVKRLIIASLGQIVALIVLHQGGLSWGAALWQGLIVSGGAMLVYEAFKPVYGSKLITAIKEKVGAA